MKKTNEILLTKVLTYEQGKEFSKYLNSDTALELIADKLITEEQKKKFFDFKVDYLVNETYEYDDLEMIKNTKNDSELWRDGINVNLMSLEEFIDYEINNPNFYREFKYMSSEDFHHKYGYMHDKIVKITFKDAIEFLGILNDKKLEDNKILLSNSIIKISDIEKIELVKE